MPHPFFPGQPFAVAAVGVLLAGLAAAAWVDFRRLTIPKPITLGLLAAGVLMNLARGAALGSAGHGVFAFGDAGAVGGAFDGLLFAVAGFATGFGLFFVQWVLGFAGGGDVKLGAAVGAWLGPSVFLVTLIFSIPVVILLVVGRMGLRLASGRPLLARPAAGTDKASPEAARARRMQSYSFPLMVGTVLAVVGLLGPELGLRPAPPAAAAN